VAVGTRTIEEDAWRLRKSAALVKLPALAPGHRLHREQLMEAPWPELGKKAASNNLRHALHAARTILNPTADSHYLASEDESLVLSSGGDVWVDVEAFEEAAATARRARDPAAHRAALDLYGGELLPEDRYEEWTEGRRQELRQLYLALFMSLQASTKSAMSMAWPSMHCARPRQESPRSKRHTQPLCGFTPSLVDPSKPSPNTNAFATPF